MKRVKDISMGYFSMDLTKLSIMRRSIVSCMSVAASHESQLLLFRFNLAPAAGTHKNFS